MFGKILALAAVCQGFAPLHAPRLLATTEVAAKMPSVPFLEAVEGLDAYVGGEKGFDPLKLSTFGFPLDFLREAELKHGRVAMLATTGFIFADFVKLPGDVHQVSSLAAHDVAVKSGAMTQILIWVSVLEFVSIVAIKEMVFEDSGRKPGDYAFDPLIFGKKDDPEWQLKELENGRLAMLAFSGIVTQAALTGKGFPYF